MTDLFAQQGITFEAAGVASSHPAGAATSPSTGQPSMPKPDVKLAVDNDAPITSNAPKGNAHMSPDEQRQALSELYPDGAASEESAASPAPAGAPQPAQTQSRDLFAERGIAAPSITQTNQAALSAGIPLGAPEKPLSVDNPPAPVEPAFSIPSKGAMSQIDFGARMAAGDTDAARAAKVATDARNNAIGLATQLYGPDQVNQWLQSPIGAVEGVERAVAENKTLPWLAGATEASQAFRLNAIAQKNTNGEPLTDADHQLVNDYLHQTLEEGVRGYTRGGKVASSIVQIPAWLYEYATADGAAKYLLGGARLATPALKTVAQIATTSAFMPAQYVAGYAERQLNASTAITDKGDLIAKQSTESPALSALMSYGYVNADVAAAMAGPGINKYVVEPGTKLLSTPVIATANLLPVTLRENLYQAYKAVDPNASYSKFMTPAGYNTALSSIGSFQLDRILRASVDYAGTPDMKFSDFVKGLPLGEDDLLVAGALTAIHGGISTSSSIMGSIMRSRGVDQATAAQTVAQHSALEKDQYIEENMNLPKSPYPTLANVPVIEKAAGEGALSDAEKAPYVAQYDQHLTSINQQAPDTSLKKPLINFIRGMGGVSVDSDLASEMNNMGITNKTAPGLFKKSSGAGELDNIPASEFNAKFKVNAPEDGNGYVDRNWLLEQISNEQHGQKIGTPPVGEHPFQRVLDEAGLDARTASAHDVYNAVGPDPEIKIAADKLGETITERDALAIRGEMHANPHLDIEDAISSYAERQAMQQFADMPAPRRAIMFDAIRSPDPAEQILKSQTAAQEANEPPPVQSNQSGFNAMWRNFRDEKLPQIYAELFNDLQPIENLSKRAKAEGANVRPGEDTQLTTSFVRSTPEWIRRNQLVNTTTWDAEGNQVITGKGLKAIYDDFDNMFLTTEPNLKARHQDFDDYLIAKRLLEEKASGRDVLVTKEQEAKSTADLARIADKYGENARFFDEFAKEIRDWDNRILHNLVTSGLKTQQWYDETVNARVHYSPLNRVVEDEFAPTGISRAGIGKDVTPSRIGSLKQFKGSEKEIKNTFQSRLRNSALILQKSAVNKLRVDIAKFASYYPEDVKVSNPAIIRESVQHSYDPKLREKLEQLVDFLGGDVERSKKIEGAKRGTLGSYSPSEKTVRLRIGTTEGTLAHEAGHMLDDVLDLKRRMLRQEGVKIELQKLAEDRIGSEHSIEKNAAGEAHFVEDINTSPKTYRDYIKNDDEIIANMFDAYVNSPEQLAKTAPKAKAAFEKIIDENPQLALLKEIKPSTNRAMETVERELRDMRGPASSLPVYIKGKRKYMELSDPIYKAFNNMRPIEMGMVERFIGGIFRGSKKVLQFGATSTPDFMLRHFYRAVGTAFLNTKGGTPVDVFKHSLVDVPKGIFAVMGKSELYHEWASSSGGLRTYMDLSDKGLAKMQKQMFSKGSMADMLNPLHWLAATKEVSDYSPRVAVFEKIKAAGGSDLEAGLASLESTGNYVRHGSLVKRINQYAPFFNDMVQGGDRLVRTIMKDPAAYSMRALATITLPQVIMTGYYLYAADDKTREEYLNLPEWRRAVSFNVKIGDTWVPIPRYFSHGFLWGSIPEKIMIWAYGGNHPETKNFWLKMMADTATSVSPVFDWTRAINPLIKSGLESITNYSFFMQRPLFSGDMQKTAPRNQYNQYTSETAKVLGKMFNFSPTDIDNTIYDMSAKVGKYATQLSDVGINTARRLAGEPVNEKPTRATDNPIYGGLIEETPRGTGTEAYAEFREHMQEASQAHNEFKETKGAEQAGFQHDNAKTLSAYPPIQSAQTQVNHLLHQIRLINSNTNLSGNDKTVQINNINDQITRLVEGANQRYRAATKK